MKINLSFAPSQIMTELNIYACYNKAKESKELKNTKTTKKKAAAKTAPAAKAGKILVNDHWPEELTEAFDHAVASKHFKGDVAETFALTLVNGQSAIILGLGDKAKITKEILRRQIAHIYKAVSGRYEDATIHLDGFLIKDLAVESISAIVESLHMTSYVFDRHLTVKKTPKLKAITLFTNEKKTAAKGFETAINEAQKIG